MLEKVFYTSVLVSDQDKALDFYTNVLGLEKRAENPTPDGPRFLTVGAEADEFHPVSKPTRAGFVALFKGSEVTAIVIHLS